MLEHVNNSHTSDQHVWPNSGFCLLENKGMSASGLFLRKEGNFSTLSNWIIEQVKFELLNPFRNLDSASLKRIRLRWASLVYFDDKRDRELTITIHQCSWSHHIMLTHHDHQWWAWCVKTSMTSLGVWYDISQKESLEWQSRGAFFSSGSVCAAAAKFVVVAQIETFASHIGDRVSTFTARLVCHKNCHFCVASKCLCHTLRVRVSQHYTCGSHNVGGCPWRWPTPLLLPPHAAKVWGLWEA